MYVGPKDKKRKCLAARDTADRWIGGCASTIKHMDMLLNTVRRMNYCKYSGRRSEIMSPEEINEVKTVNSLDEAIADINKIVF